MESVHERDAGATSQRFAAAMRERDFETLGETLAADVVLHSPITGSFPFEGREQVLDLLRIVRGALEDLNPVASFGDDDTHGACRRRRSSPRGSGPRARRARSAAGPGPARAPRTGSCR